MDLIDSEKKILKVFPFISLWKLLIPSAGPVWTLKACSTDHLTLLHTKYINCGHYGFKYFYSVNVRNVTKIRKSIQTSNTPDPGYYMGE